MATRIFTLCNVKGGVSKSTSTVNIAYGLAYSGYKVLIVDMDPQCNSTYTITGTLNEDGDGEDTLYDVLIPKEQRDINEIILPTQHENLFLAPGSIWLSSADLQIGGLPNREKRLSKALRAVSGYDFILIDTQPSLGLLTVNAMIAATDLIIPISLTIYGLLGIRLLNVSLNDLRQNMELPMPILGVVACLGDNTRNSKDRLNQVKEYFGDKVFQTVIPRNIKVEESNDQAISLFDYAPGSTGAKAYATLVKEIIERVTA
jgi:chromosome partitioning protein